jgi:hypothetical protein
MVIFCTLPGEALQKNYFLELIRNFRTGSTARAINRKRLPPITGSESYPLTRDDAGDLPNDQVTAGQLASYCQYWLMANGCIWQVGMSGMDATVRMFLEIRHRDNPFARGTS